MEKLLTKLRQETECSLCMETFTDPKTLPCLHTYCKKCIKQHSDRNGDKTTFTCPICQAKINKPQENDFNKFPVSFFYNNLLDILAIRKCEAGSDITCSACKKNVRQSSYCFDCSKFLCEDCLNAHTLMVHLTGSHKVVALRDFKADDYENLLKSQPFCQERFHEKDPLRYYCNTCDQCICQTCAVLAQHKEHKIVLVDEGSIEPKRVLLAKVESLKQLQTNTEKIIKGLEERVGQLVDNTETAKQEISIAAEELIVIIETNKRDLLLKLDAEEEEKEERMRGEKAEHQSILRQILSARDYASKLIDRGSPSEILLTKNSLYYRCDELLSCGREIELAVKATMTFIPSKASEMLSDMGLGVVSPLKTVPCMSTIEVNTEPLEALSIVKLTVHTKASKRRTSDHPGDAITVKVFPAEDVKELKVSERMPGKFKVQFVPKVPGEFKVEVTINGKSVGNSPLGMNVKSQRMKITEVFEMTGMEKSLQKPWGIAVNRDNTCIAVSDLETCCVYLFSMEGLLKRTIGRKGQNNGELRCPRGIAFLDDELLVVADASNKCVQVFNCETGDFVRSYETCNGDIANCIYPWGVHVDDKGQVIVCDGENERIKVYTMDGIFLYELFTTEMDGCRPVYLTTSGDFWILSDKKNHCIRAIDRKNGTSTIIGTKGEKECELENPRDLIIDQDGNVIVCELSNQRIQKFTFDGRFVGKTCGDINKPACLITLTDGRVMATDNGNGRVVFID